MKGLVALRAAVEGNAMDEVFFSLDDVLCQSNSILASKMGCTDWSCMCYIVNIGRPTRFGLNIMGVLELFQANKISTCTSDMPVTLCV